MTDPPPQFPPHFEELYRAVANRRMHYERLLWQAPALSLTAQAFLFNIALNQNNTPAGRIAAASLALTLSLLSLGLMASHRRALLTDTQWLERFEQQELGAGEWVAHGAAFTRAQPAIPDLDAGLVGKLPLKHVFRAWIAGIGVFAICAVLVIIRTLVTVVF
ncbi:MAG: hypothetical protein EOP32_02810 [Rhodococcus sp. (in: high G+C Gram-positive bacteria)]|nr:MAG: hypothetical protein EOP32_02810 [Rhodococcus sp. (in: high G+C Gram-positive bacteria)]